ncbi:MAG: DNA cytosine methyltransferase [Verrucomicrobia bacterium]|nr:DNA cytosine methyltransferase [Verrucomicrobiota bacterium]
MPKPFTYVEGFSGPGGMSLGLQRAGFQLKYAFDISEKAVSTHNANLGNHAEVKDAREVDGFTLMDQWGIQPKDLDLFAGGPPCQGFSKQKRGAHLGDKRNDLVLEYIRLVKEFEPKFFFFENVAVFGQKRGREFLHKMHEELHDYQINAFFLNSANFGLAQTRQRFVVVGKHIDVAASFVLPEKVVDQWQTLRDVIGDLPEPPSDFTCHPHFFNHQNAKVTDLNVHRFSHVPPGGGWRDIPFDLRMACHKRVDIRSGGWPDVFGRLQWDGQCPTITGGFDSFTRGRYGHPEANRPLTPREAARLQGFPDEFNFHGTRGDIRSQIGNAVPPPLAETVGICIARSLLCHYGFISDTFPQEVLFEKSESIY